MIALNGIIRDGVVRAEVPLPGLEGRRVIITVLDEEGDDGPDPDYDPANDPLMKLIDECQMPTGISDLAHQHDHYLYGTPKKP